MEIKNKKIIVTGAGAGIGQELTWQLISLGAQVIALDINEEGLKITKAKAALPDQVIIVPLNITDREAINKLAIDYPEVDIIINNAGIIQPFVNVDKLEMNTINKVMDVNFYGPLYLIKSYLPKLLNKSEAHIVNVSSMGGFFPFPGQTIYGASKAALKLFTEGLYAELLNTNVHVTVVMPGAIATNIAANSGAQMSTEATNGKMKMLSANKAAAIIIKAILKNKFQVFVGSDSKMMNLMYKLNAKGAIKYINKMMAKVMPKKQ
ncbi:MAG TPA: SDR family oxidoreductase [Bacilli bacterium]|nr:SDR family oxidoreductase [Bacilli bacterium]